ncbi:MAG: hypothetical protein KAV87_19240 [Desulfobacteraceae bacterium]|nr:hypothetical protein [Desulfobacteraceae bacterium]
MMTEKEWVESLAHRLEGFSQGLCTAGREVGVEAHKKLLYAHEVFEYDTSLTGTPIVSDFQTDLLIFDKLTNNRWTPRVVIECKVGDVTTHDALIYSTKARTHKQVHPYLRYGILIGGLGEDGVPGRLFRHGPYFDFMVAWAHLKPSKQKWDEFTDMLAKEIRASRRISYMLRESRSRSRKRYTIVHRPLRFKD